jgi:putative FmdB family regulatory protein
MPFYEFYCEPCHTIFRFFSRRVNTQTRPSCPRCGRLELEKRPSTFAISKGGREDKDTDSDMPDLDDARMEQALASMAGEMEGLDEDDPKAAARMMRRLFEAGGMRMGPGIEEAMRRMEAGEDPDQIEAELGDVLENEDPFSPAAAKGLRSVQALRRRYLPPKVDEGLYEL